MKKQNKGISTRHNPFVSSKTATAGITLIAIVITIIVLLILAGVSIATLTGENGILTQAEDAKKKTTEEEARERIQLEIIASIGNDGKYNVEKAKQNLKENLSLVENDENAGYKDVSYGRLTIKYKGYEIYVDENGNASYEKHKVIFKPEDLTIEEATNTDKYGCKVTKYDVKTNDCPSGVWRLFYQDINYTYLINDELTGTIYKPSDYYTTITDEEGNLKYQTGADVSTIGQKLSPTISSLFTEENTNANIRFTAWMTDPEVWKDYKDDNGDALFAIGSPTADLFAASYNATGKTNTITLGLGTYGYTDNTDDNKWLSQSDNYGIYNKDGWNNWWLASPNDSSDYSGGNYGLNVRGWARQFLSVLPS